MNRFVLTWRVGPTWSAARNRAKRRVLVELSPKRVVLTLPEEKKKSIAWLSARHAAHQICDTWRSLVQRLGIKCLVLESSDILRATGISFTVLTNAWRALDALGIGDSLRVSSLSSVTGELTSYVSFTEKGKYGDHGVRCVRRKALLEALAKDLPTGTIRYSSKVVSIEEAGFSKLVHLADGSILKTKVLIGCDGVNSMVAKWLGFKAPSLTGRSAIRGCAYYKDGHGFEPEFQVLVGNGARYGIIPCDNTAVYWFFTWSPSAQENSTLQDADQLKLKQFLLGKLGKVPDKIRAVIEDTKVEEIPQWQIIFGSISKDNVCVAGDACHPMTPDLTQGACSALEDGVILGRCLADVLLEKSSCQEKQNDENEDEYERIKRGLNNYAKKRRWRAFDLISTGYMLSWLQEFDGFGMRILREKLLSAYLTGFFY